MKWEYALLTLCILNNLSVCLTEEEQEVEVEIPKVPTGTYDNLINFIMKVKNFYKPFDGFLTSMMYGMKFPYAVICINQLEKPLDVALEILKMANNELPPPTAFDMVTMIEEMITFIVDEPFEDCMDAGIWGINIYKIAVQYVSNPGKELLQMIINIFVNGANIYSYLRDLISRIEYKDYGYSFGADLGYLIFNILLDNIIPE